MKIVAAFVILAVAAIISTVGCSSRVGPVDCTGAFCRRACDTDEDCEGLNVAGCTGAECREDGCYPTGCSSGKLVVDGGIDDAGNDAQ